MLHRTRLNHHQFKQARKLPKFLHVYAFCWRRFFHNSTSEQQLPNINILQPASGFSLLSNIQIVSISVCFSLTLPLCLPPSLSLSLSCPLALSLYWIVSLVFLFVLLHLHLTPLAFPVSNCSVIDILTQLLSSPCHSYVIPMFVRAPQRCWPGKATLSRGRTQILESPKPSLAHSNFPKCPRTHCRIQWQLEEGGPYVSRIERMRALTYHWMYLSLHLRMGAKGRLDYSWETATMDLTCT